MNTYFGIVQKGTKRASALGFPTINISLENKSVAGIYAANVMIGEKKYSAAAFADPTREVLEAYLLDFPVQELYGKEITIELVKKIRESKMFSSDEELKQAIAEDIEAVRKLS